MNNIPILRCIASQTADDLGLDPSDIEYVVCNLTGYTEFRRRALNQNGITQRDIDAFLRSLGRKEVPITMPLDWTPFF